MAVAVVVVEPWKRAFKVVRRAVGARPAIDLVAYLCINILRPFNVIADEQIELPVVVVIHPRSARAPVIGRSTDSSHRGHFLELAVSFIVKQVVAAHRRDEHVIQSVVVVIPNRHAHSVETHVEPGTGCGIGEMAFAIVVIQCRGGRFFPFGHVPGPVG